MYSTLIKTFDVKAIDIIWLLGQKQMDSAEPHILISESWLI